MLNVLNVFMLCCPHEASLQLRTTGVFKEFSKRRSLIFIIVDNFGKSGLNFIIFTVKFRKILQERLK